MLEAKERLYKQELNRQKEDINIHSVELSDPTLLSVGVEVELEQLSSQLTETSTVLRNELAELQKQLERYL